MLLEVGFSLQQLVESWKGFCALNGSYGSTREGLKWAERVSRSFLFLTRIIQVVSQV